MLASNGKSSPTDRLLGEPTTSPTSTVRLFQPLVVVDGENNKEGDNGTSYNHVENGENGEGDSETPYNHVELPTGNSINRPADAKSDNNESKAYTTCKKHSWTTLKITIAIIAASTFAINAMMAPSLKGTSALAKADHIMNAWQWTLGAMFLLASYAVNIPQAFTFPPKLHKELKKISSPNTTRKTKCGNAGLAILTACAGFTQGVISYQTYKFIPDTDVRFALTLVNVSVSFFMTWATRFVGSKKLLNMLGQTRNPNNQLQNKITRILKNIKNAEDILELNQRARVIYDTQTKNLFSAHPELHPEDTRLNKYEKDELRGRVIAFAFIHDTAVCNIIGKYVKQSECWNSLLYWTRMISAITLGGAATMVFMQKFIDGLELLLGNHAIGLLPTAAKIILALLPGLTSGAFYGASTFNAIPIIKDSFYRNTILAVTLTLAINLLACPSMFVVALTVVNKLNMFSYILPNATEGWRDYVFPVLVALGAAFANYIPVVTSTTRSPGLNDSNCGPATQSPQAFNTMIYALETTVNCVANIHKHAKHSFQQKYMNIGLFKPTDEAKANFLIRFAPNPEHRRTHSILPDTTPTIVPQQNLSNGV